MWTLLKPAGLVESNQPSFKGALSIPVHWYYTCSRDCKYNINNSDERMTKVNKDLKHQAHNTDKHAKLTASCWKQSDAHLDFQNGSCWQKCKQPAAGGIWVIILLKVKPGLLGDGLHMTTESVWSREGISIQIYLVGICSEALAFKSSVDEPLGHRNLSNLLSTCSAVFCTHCYFFSAFLSPTISNIILLLRSISANYSA